MSRRVAACLPLLAALACGSNGNEPAEPRQPEAAAEPAPQSAAEIDPEWKRLGDMAVVLFRKLHGVVKTNAGDCDAMGGGLESLVEENQAFIKEARAYKTDVAFTRWFDHTYGPELAVLAGELGPVLQNCSGNPKVQAAMQRFGS
jgi:hypothetical protein